MENLNPTFELVYQYKIVFIAIGILVGAMGFFKAATGLVRGHGAAGGIANIVLGTTIICFPQLLPVIVNAPNFLFNLFGLTVPDVPSDAKTTEPAVETSAPADLSWVPGVLVAAGVATAALLAGLGLFHYYRKSLAPSLAKKRSEAKTAGALVAEARKTLEWVVLDSASYETDLAKQIDYPMMTDVSEPRVGKYVREMRYAQELERALAAKPLMDDAERFSNAVHSLKVSYDGAVRKAETVRWSSFSFAEQKRLKDARIALDVVQDSSTTPEQRNAQYRRIAKLLDGLIVLTEPVKQSLATWVPMLALEGTKTTVAAADSLKSPVAV